MTDETREQSILSHFVRSREVLDRAVEDRALMQSMLAIADAIVRAFRAGGKLMLAGNGGSAADAQHIAGELVGRLNFDRNPLPAIAFTTDSSVLTAIGNDYGYEQVFERQIRGLGVAGDVFFALSTSGRSRNILRAIEAARDKRLTVIGFTGRSGGEMRRHCDICLSAPSDATPQAAACRLACRETDCRSRAPDRCR